LPSSEWSRSEIRSDESNRSVSDDRDQLEQHDFADPIRFLFRSNKIHAMKKYELYVIFSCLSDMIC